MKYPRYFWSPDSLRLDFRNKQTDNKKHQLPNCAGERAVAQAVQKHCGNSYYRDVQDAQTSSWQHDLAALLEKMDPKVPSNLCHSVILRNLDVFFFSQMSTITPNEEIK